ncbi:MAG TPA: glycosyltransferase family 2 protein [Hyphomicrobiaceae bacterium]|jgi:glycosyltransferase involved in cell wall biosynthesis
MDVSVLLLTFNEAELMPRCLAALAWCDDILVIDSGSTDDTVKIAEGAGARVIYRPFDNFANQRNFGLAYGGLRHGWVLHLDADEVVTPEFRAQLNKLEPPPEIDAYRVPSKLMLGGAWLRHAGTYPTYQVRLGHRDRLRFKQVGHGQREDLSLERVGMFNEPYLHYNFSHGLVNWLRKHVRYAEDEANLLVRMRRGEVDALDGGRSDSTTRRRALKQLTNRMPLLTRPAARFFYTLVWRRGLLDGRYGILYALMLSVYEGMIAILATEKLMQLSERPSAGDEEATPPAKSERASPTAGPNCTE